MGADGQLADLVAWAQAGNSGSSSSGSTRHRSLGRWLPSIRRSWGAARRQDRAEFGHAVDADDLDTKHSILEGA